MRSPEQTLCPFRAFRLPSGRDILLLHRLLKPGGLVMLIEPLGPEEDTVEAAVEEPVVEEAAVVESAVVEEEAPAAPAPAAPVAAPALVPAPAPAAAPVSPARRDAGRGGARDGVAGGRHAHVRVDQAAARRDGCRFEDVQAHLGRDRL